MIEIDNREQNNTFKNNEDNGSSFSNKQNKQSSILQKHRVNDLLKENKVLENENDLLRKLGIERMKKINCCILKLTY